MNINPNETMIFFPTGGSINVETAMENSFENVVRKQHGPARVLRLSDVDWAQIEEIHPAADSPLND